MTTSPHGFRGLFRADDVTRARYAEGAGIFRIIPAAVARPADLEDLRTLARWASRTGTALTPRGAGSGMPGGNVGPGVIVDLRAFASLPAVDPERRTARAGAATTCAALNAAAKMHGLRLPPTPSSAAFCTIGGMASTNAAGAHSFKYGPMRDWTHELAFTTIDGESGRATKVDPALAASTSAERRLVSDVAPRMRQVQLPLETAGPKTRKNVAGYRLANYPDSGWVRHLLIGSEGTLAFLTEVQVRLAPVPARTASLLIPLRSLDEVAPAVRRLAASKPAAIELLDRTYLDFARAQGAGVPADAEAVLLVELEDEGAESPSLEGWGPDAVLATDAATSDRIWSLRHRASPILAALPDTTRSLQVLEDGCVPLERLGEYIKGLRRIAADAGFRIVIFGHAGDAHVHANLLVDTGAADLAPRLERCLAEASALQVSLKGTTTGEHGDGRLRARFLEQIYGPQYVEIMRLVKTAFDPRGLMNPGVKLPAPGSRLTAHDLKVGSGAPTLPPGIAEELRAIEQGARWGDDRLAD